jgi:hypothetical protein
MYSLNVYPLKTCSQQGRANQRVAFIIFKKQRSSQKCHLSHASAVIKYLGATFNGGCGQLAQAPKVSDMAGLSTIFLTLGVPALLVFFVKLSAARQLIWKLQRAGLVS